MVGAGISVDVELTPDWAAGGIKTLAPYLVFATTLTERLPRHDEPAIGKSSYAWRVLIAGGIGIDMELTSSRVARNVETLAPDLV